MKKADRYIMIGTYKKSSRVVATILLCIMLVVTLSLVLVSCITAKEIKLSDLVLRIKPDGSVSELAGNNTYSLHKNIDRGFRLETYYTLGSGKAYPTDTCDCGNNPCTCGYDMLEDEISFYKSDSPTEIQVYIYLTEYVDRPLDDYALGQLKEYFEKIRGKKMSMLLRFAYDTENDKSLQNSPTEEMMLRHIAQIKQFNVSNVELVNDTVTAYQFGMIGAWGEWGATSQKYDEKKVLNALIDAFPEGTYYQGRYMRVTNQVRKNERHEYIGYHNDFLVGRPHPWNTAGDKYGSINYRRFRNTVQQRMNDGEMPWGGYSDEPNEEINGINFLKQMREHSMNTLSIKHNYKEDRVGKDGVVRNRHNLYRWKSEYITPEILSANKLPYYERWFEDEFGNKIEKSIYDYLQDYLGYLLVISNLKIDGNEVSFVVTNYGLGTPLTLDYIKLGVFEKDGGLVKEYPIEGFDVRQLVTYGQLELTVTVDRSLENKRLGVQIGRECSAGDYYIRTANGAGQAEGTYGMYNLIKK